MTEQGERRGWRLVRASRDAVPAWVRRFFQAPRPSRRLPGSRRGWALVAVAVVLALAAGWVLWGTSLAGVRDVRVTGTEILSPAVVRDAAAVPEQIPLLRVRTGEVAARVAELAPVAQVRVGRAWPDAVVIEVVERTAVAAVPAGEEVLLVDRTGVVFHTVGRAPAELPVVILAEPGPDDPATVAALTVVASLTPPLRAELAALAVVGPANIQLALASGTTVVWGDETDSDLKARIATALLDRDVEVIDVSAPEVVSLR